MPRAAPRQMATSAPQPSATPGLCSSAYSEPLWRAGHGAGRRASREAARPCWLVQTLKVGQPRRTDLKESPEYGAGQGPRLELD